jgi:DNA invertase Pin-like site-specific DNA recombinase
MEANLTESPTRAAIYTRVSTDEQASDGYSLAEQERQALAKIEREGWVHVNTFSDPAVSGAERERPGTGLGVDLRAQRRPGKS